MIAKFYTDNDAKPTLISCEKCKNMYEHEVTCETQKQRWFGAISINITEVRRESPRLQPWDERRVPRICASN